METTIRALYLGAKVTEFESSRYLKVFLSGTGEDDEPNIYGWLFSNSRLLCNQQVD